MVGAGVGSTTVELSCVAPGRTRVDALPCAGTAVTAVAISGGTTLEEAALKPSSSCKERLGLVRFHM